MALFERLSNTLSSAGKDGLNKAKEIKDTAKINIDIREREGSIQKMYRELGKAYYQDHKEDAAPDYSQVFAIKAAFEEIGELKATKDELRGIKRCSNCGNIISYKAKFCSNCGEKFEEPEEVFTGDIDDALNADYQEVTEDEPGTCEKVIDAAESVVKDQKEAVKDAAHDTREFIREAADKAEDLARDAAQKAEGVVKDIAHRVEDYIDKKAD